MKGSLASPRGDESPDRRMVPMVENNEETKKGINMNGDKNLLSRRAFVQKATKMTGAFAAGIFCLKDLGSMAFALERRGDGCALDPVKLELRFDEKKCASCRYCEIACAQYHEGNANPVTHRNRIVIRPILEFIGVSALSANAPGWPQPLANATFAEFSENHFCRQCPSPECMDACPERAIYVDKKTGARVIDKDLCIGDGSCVKACQFNMIHINKGTNQAFKCDLCGGDPQCAKWCPTGAITVKKL
jgi:Fe-S-cluster-containing dehydrogenase component